MIQQETLLQKWMLQITMVREDQPIAYVRQRPADSRRQFNEIYCVTDGKEEPIIDQKVRRKVGYRKEAKKITGASYAIIVRDSFISSNYETGGSTLKYQREILHVYVRESCRGERAEMFMDALWQLANA